jgi:alkaline phosphatase D
LGNLPLERWRLLDTIRDSGAKGVVLLSGDRHAGALYRETTPGLYPLYEVTSSGLNMVFWDAKEPGPNRLSALYPAASFGTDEIYWPQHKITLALRDNKGSTQRSTILSFDELGIPG